MKRILCIVLLLSLCGRGVAGSAPVPPANLNQRADWDQRLGAQAPAGQVFRDTNGQSTTLAALSDGKPLLLSFGYYHCPNLCDMILQGLADAAGHVPLRVGRDYQIVFVSIDPHETPADAAQVAHHLAQLHPDADVDRWHLLTGDEAAIRKLTDAVGFRYFYDSRIDQYAHPAGAVVLTSVAPAVPAIAQYFFGVSFVPGALRLALVQASHGKLGTVIDQLVLLCCGYDPETGRYSVLIGRVMQIIGIGFVLLMGTWLLWMRRRRAAA